MRLSWVLITLSSLRLFVSAADPICSLPMEIGSCKGIVPRFFFNSSVQECHRFYYGGCRGNENNFASLEECNQRCLQHTNKMVKINSDNDSSKSSSNDANSDSSDESENTETENTETENDANAANDDLDNNQDEDQSPDSSGTVLLIGESSSMEMDKVDFDNDTYGTWEAEDMEIEAMETNGTNKVAQPLYYMTEPRKGGRLRRTLQFAMDRHFELDMDVLVKQYNATAALAEVNPSLKVRLMSMDNVDMTNETGNVGNRTTNMTKKMVELFDLDDYANFFANQQDWVTLRLVLPNDGRFKGATVLEVWSQQGNEMNSTIMMDNLTVSSTRRLRTSLEMEEDNKESNDTINTTTTPTTTMTTPIETTMKEDNDQTTTQAPNTTTTEQTTTTTTTTTTETPTMNTAGDNTVELILVCIIILLLVGLVVLSIKYWKLRQETFGTYNVKATPTDTGSFDNPMYGGHNQAPNYPDRFGVLRD